MIGSENMELKDALHWSPEWTIDKFDDVDQRIARATQAGKPIRLVRAMFPERFIRRDKFKGNLLLNGGINVAWGLICGAGGTAFNNANAYIDVGDSAAVAAPTQTGIQALTNRLAKAMDSSYPLAAANQQEVWRSTFASADANWVWNEIVVSNANDFVHGLNRLVQNMGTKASGATWVVSLTITLS
jgi:hypothetical protein